MGIPLEDVETRGKKALHVFAIGNDEFWAYEQCTKRMQQALSLIDARLEMVRDLTTAESVLKGDSGAARVVLLVLPGPVPKRRTLLPWDDFFKRGGVLIICGQFASLVRSDDADHFFATKLKLPWKIGNHFRTTDVASPAARQILSLTSGIPDSFSNKAVRLANVASGDRLYVPGPSSRLESSSLRDRSVDTEEPSVALTARDAGNVAYIGDVNDEAGSAVVVKCMCEWALGLSPGVERGPGGSGGPVSLSSSRCIPPC